MTESDITITNDGTTLQIYLQYTIKETGEINQYNLDISTLDNPDRI